MNFAWRVMSGPIWAHVQGAPVARRRRAGVDEPTTFSTLPAALDWVLGMLERYNRVTAHVSSSSPPWHSVGIFRVRDKELLLVANTREGEGPAATLIPDIVAERAVAGLLPAHGFRQVLLPPSATPLVTLGPLLPSRIINLLLREGSTTVEQIAVLPDAALLGMRSMGVIGLGELRAAITTLQETRPPEQSTSSEARSGDELLTPAREPVPSTPLQALGAQITARTLNLLLREGFTTVEEVAAIPDDDLLQIRHMGAPSVTTVRNAIATLQAATYPADTTIVISGDHVRELVTLLSTLAVYADASGRTEVAHRARSFLNETTQPIWRPAPGGPT